MLVLDGSYGEGGGQIVRTALALAALTGTPLQLINIRAHRPKPGLRPQHLTAVQALARITEADLEGAALGSSSLTFFPGRLAGGTYRFDVAQQTGSAGSVTLLAQTLLPVLAWARQPSTLILSGGTHVPWSPPFHYFAAVFLPALEEMGLTTTAALRRWGFYPQGGGEIHLTVTPTARLQGVEWLTPPHPAQFQGLSAAANLPEHVIRRQSRILRELAPSPLLIREEMATARGPGSFVFLWGPRAGFSALGAKGKPAEQVASEACREWRSFLASGAAVDRHLADQILIYAALAAGQTTLSTEAVSRHLLTNIWVLGRLLGVAIQVDGAEGTPGTVQVQGIGFQAL